MGAGGGLVTPSDLCKAGLVVSAVERLGCWIIKYFAEAGWTLSRLENEMRWLSGETGLRLPVLWPRQLTAVLLSGWITNGFWWWW